jgi:hypothetical protein
MSAVARRNGSRETGAEFIVTPIRLLGSDTWK